MRTGFDTSLAVYLGGCDCSRPIPLRRMSFHAAASITVLESGIQAQIRICTAFGCSKNGAAPLKGRHHLPLMARLGPVLGVSH